MFKIVLLLFFVLLSACNSLPEVTGSDTKQIAEEEAVINTKHRDSPKKRSASDNYARLGAGYLARKNYEKALIKLKKAISLNHNNALAYNYLGILYWELEKPDLAEKNFRISQRLSPYNAAVNHNFAMFLCDQKHYQQANKLFDRVFENPLYDRLAAAYQAAADCDYHQNHFDSALKKYQHSLKINQKNPFSLLGMAKLYYRKKKYKIAQYYFERFERISQHTPESLWLGINLQYKLRDKNKLSSYILTLKNLYPDAKETLWYIEGKQEF